MNCLKGRIHSVESTEAISLVEVKIGGDLFSAFVLETPRSCAYLKEGCSVAVLFKETEVSLAKGLEGKISLRNRFKGPIRRINGGKILTEVEIDYGGVTIRSVISSRSARDLELTPGEEILWLVKSNELSLMEL